MNTTIWRICHEDTKNGSRNEEGAGMIPEPLLEPAEAVRLPETMTLSRG